ncbi:MAG: sugar transferase [Phycisphaeraceae bacterium]
MGQSPTTIRPLRGGGDPAGRDPRQVSIGFRLAKRSLDLAGALAGLVLAGPVMLACAVWIRCVDGGPVFYRQWRVGHRGWLFRLYKFRTMSLDAERHGAQFAQKGDPRIVPGCRWMRKSHLDELPQLFNVLLGQMSLVGPRPERPEIFERFRERLPSMERRLAGRPGLTGLAQVSCGYSNDLAGIRRKLAADLRYLRQPSVLGDLRLLGLTLPRLWDHSAC